MCWVGAANNWRPTISCGAGYAILERNWRCRAGEIDLVAQDGTETVFVEVKTRSSVAFGHPLEAITAQKLARLRRLAAALVRGASRATPRHPHRRDRGPRAAERRGSARAPAAGVLMALGRTHSVSLLGLHGAVVQIEADISSNLPGFYIIGLPDAALGEARERVRAATNNSGCEFPTHRLTVNLSPAALPKHGSGFDLGIALAILAASGERQRRVGRSGRAPRRAGSRRAAAADQRHPARRAGRGAGRFCDGDGPRRQRGRGVARPGDPGGRRGVAPRGGDLARRRTGADSGRAAHPSGRSRRRGRRVGRPRRRHRQRRRRRGAWSSPRRVATTCCCSARRAQARPCSPPRLPGLLPDLLRRGTRSRSARSGRCAGCRSDRPLADPATVLEAPHHTATAAALVGGGSAHHPPGRRRAGMPRRALPRRGARVLARPCSTRYASRWSRAIITIHRANAVARFPARFQLVLAANPCPCGQYGAAGLELHLRTQRATPLPGAALRPAARPHRHPIPGESDHLGTTEARRRGTPGDHRYGPRQGERGA